jgi:hypothetical protein
MEISEMISKLCTQMELEKASSSILIRFEDLDRFDEVLPSNRGQRLREDAPKNGSLTSALEIFIIPFHCPESDFSVVPSGRLAIRLN